MENETKMIGIEIKGVLQLDEDRNFRYYCPYCEDYYSFRKSELIQHINKFHFEIVRREFGLLD